MISKELLSAVLNVDIMDEPFDRIDEDTNETEVIDTNMYLSGNRLVFWYLGEYNTYPKEYRANINIYELAHKCKEWGVNQQLKHNFHISVVTHKGSEFSATIAYWSDQLKNESFRASSEPEAVFKACEWILNNKQVVND